MNLCLACKVLYNCFLYETKIICRVIFIPVAKELFVRANEALHIYSVSLKSKIFPL